jgi:hypothetical protein
MHKGFVSGDREVSEHLSRLYEKGITGKSADTKAQQSARQEIDAIRNDASNPRHEKWKKQDPKTVEHLDSLYKQLAPEEDGAEQAPPEVVKENVRRIVGMVAGADFDQAFVNVSTLKDRFAEGEERNAFYQVAAAVEEAVGEEMALRIAFKLFGK